MFSPLSFDIGNGDELRNYPSLIEKIKHFYTDINECELGKCPDFSVCTNTGGSYLCTCIDGYMMENGTCVGKIYKYLLINIQNHTPSFMCVYLENI